MKNNFHVSGIHIGEHSFVPAEIIHEMESRKAAKTSFMTIRTSATPVAPEFFYAWAAWCKAHRVYFMFLYTVQQAPKGQQSHFTADMVKKIREIAGEYFLGDQIGEVGTAYGACPKGYGALMPPLYDMKDCADTFIRVFRDLARVDEGLGMPNIVPLEPTAMIKYTLDAGGTLPLLEMLPGDPEFLVSLTRGCAHAKELDLWGTYIAHEWYGGVRNDDFLKQQRLKVAYGYTYISGSHIICLESGDERITSYGSSYYPGDAVCDAYSEQMLQYEAFIRSHERIAPEPLRKIALVFGNLDAYTGFMGQSVWEQFDRPEWSMGDAERSWNITKDLHHGRSWQDVENYGEDDLSFAPAYGLYDVLPADAPARRMKMYDTLIFVGWNTMTEQILANLKEFVADGGYLFMTGAHLNTNTKRDGRFLPIRDGHLSDFLGFDLGDIQPVNLGLKFGRDSLRKDVRFPVVPGGRADPILAGGMLRRIDAKITTAEVIAYWHDSFLSPTATPTPAETNGKPWTNEQHPALLENAYGSGVVAVLATADYPGAGGVYPAYRTIVRELMTASHRSCDVKVISTDKLRFSVYRGACEDMICLLNTDLTRQTHVTIQAHGKRIDRVLDPCEVAVEKILRQTESR